MSLGAVLVRPQPLTAPDTPISVGDVIIAFAESLLKDPEASVAAVQIMGAEALNSLRDFLSGFEEPMRLADGKVRAVFQPFVGPVNAIIAAFDGEALTILPNVLQGLMQFLQELTAANIVNFLQGLFDVILTDLGVSGGGLLGVLTTTITHMVEKLQTGVENGDMSDQSVALYDFGTGLDDILALLQKDIDFPTLDISAVLSEVRAVWANLGIDRIIALIEAILQKGDQLLTPIATIAQAVVDVEVNVKVTPQAANGNGTPAPAENPSDPIAWYASWVAGNVVRFPSDTGQSTNLFDNQYLLGFTYKRISRETMEKIAYHTAWLAPVIELVLFHATSMEKGDITNNLVQLLYDGTDAGLIIFKKYKLHWGWGWLPLLTFPWIGPTAESGGRSCWWWHDIADAVENLMYRRWCWEMREALLSVLTLLNYDDAAFQQILSTRSNQVEKDATTLASNPYYFDGTIIAIIEIGSLFLFGFYRDRGAFYLDTGVSIFSLPPIQQAVSIGWLWPMAMTIVGYVIARPLSGQPLFSSSGLHVFAVFFRERLLGKYSFADGASGFWAVARCVFGFLLYPLEYLIYRFVFTTGDTDGGTLALDTQGNDAPKKFLGYPDPSTSPYLIPWVDSQRMCVQGNLGIVSHNAHDGTGQVYAVDIEMAEGQDIVASRAGIIVNIRDTIATGDHSDGWNFVEIMHLVLDKVPA